MHESLMHTTQGMLVHTEPQFQRSRGRKIRSSMSSWLDSKFEAILSYMSPCVMRERKEKKDWSYNLAVEYLLQSTRP